MNGLDIILLILLGFGAVKGYRTGLLMGIFSIMAFVLAIIGSFKLMEQGMELLDSQFDINGTFLPYLAFFLIFIGIIILVNLVGRSVKKIMDMTLLGSFDDVAGAVVGILKWAFGISVIIWIISSMDLFLPEEKTSDSLLFPIVAGIAPTVIDWFSFLFPVLEGLFESVQDLLTNPNP